MGPQVSGEEAVRRGVNGYDKVPSADLIGAHVRVVARRGYVVEGICIDAWSLDSGGLAVKIKPLDGSPPREVTTLQPPVLFQASGDEATGEHRYRI
jgi:hypothetical protein